MRLLNFLFFYSPLYNVFPIQDYCKGGREGRGSTEGNNMEEGFKERESLLVGDYIRKPVINIITVQLDLT